MSTSPEHASVRAYTIGFILSLIFTFIPYYLVVEKVVTGTSLLVTILGFGVLQMLVQVFFFLHLGRGPKPLYNVFFFVATVVTILVVVGGSIVISTNLHYSMKPTDQVKKIANDEGIYEVNGKKTGACQGQHTNHQMMIMNGLVTPGALTANKCDTLTFMNHEGKSIDIMFGNPEKQTTYAGVAIYTLRADRNKTITLSETGTYIFYDSAHPETSGSFTVVD